MAALSTGHMAASMRRSGFSTLCLFGAGTHVVAQRSNRDVPRFKGGRLGTTTARRCRAQRNENKMFGTIKNVIALGAVVAVSALAPAVASADNWSIDGTNPFAGAADIHGTLTTMTQSGVTTTCEVTGTLDLDNAGVSPWDNAHGVVTDFAMDNCDTSLTGCTVTAQATDLPWTVDTLGTSVTITDASFTNFYAGPSCPLNGAAVSASGDVTGTVVGDDIVFDGATGLTSPLVGPLTLDGVVNATDEETGAPVTLIPEV